MDHVVEVTSIDVGVIGEDQTMSWVDFDLGGWWFVVILNLVRFLVLFGFASLLLSWF